MSVDSIVSLAALGTLREEERLWRTTGRAAAAVLVEPADGDVDALSGFLAALSVS